MSKLFEAIPLFDTSFFAELLTNIAFLHKNKANKFKQQEIKLFELN